MESSSEHQHRVLSSWRGLLITASILSCWIQPMSAQISVVPNPPFGEVNHNVTLEIQGFTGRALTYTWYRKAVADVNEIAVYTVATGVQDPAGIREKVLPNGSLLIPHLTLSDTDDYHVTIVNSQGGIIVGQGHLTVYEKTTKPNLTVNRTNVIENDTLVFICGTEQAGVDILWFFNNKSLILNERMKLSMNNQTLTILSVKREDIGSYQCEIRNSISSNRSDPITLTVNYGPDYITFVPNSEKGEIEVKFKGSLTLECHVESYPPAQYRWQINGTVNPAFSNNIYVIKNAIWEDSGKYTCQAKNNVTNLSVSKSITIKVDEQNMGGSNGSSFSGGAITGIVIGVLTAVTLIGTLIYIRYFRQTRRTSKDQLSEKNHSARQHGEDIILYENTVHFRGSALPAQGPGSSPIFPEDLPESSYQTLDITRVDVYDKIDPWKKPEV
ncbi:cell adhesion molecule CEACAM6-like [Sarcophilus harrisii]